MTIRTVFSALLAAFAFLVSSAAQAAIDPATAQKLLAEDRADNKRFGYSVSVADRTALIGAMRDNGKGSDSGTAYVFALSSGGTWTQQAKLVADDGAAGDYFGYSVALSGDGNIALIGAPYDSDKSGSVYVFVRSSDGTWTQQSKLTAGDGAAEDQFGYSVAFFGNTALIGSPFDDDKGNESGSAYIFVCSSTGAWIQQNKLTATDGWTGDYFGHAVSLSGGTALIGAFGDDDKGSSSGSAYLFSPSVDGVWTQQNKLTANDAAAGDYFGYSLSLSGGTALIGAPFDDDKGAESGAAYVFVRSADESWLQKSKLVAGDGSADDQFGWSVSVSGNTALIGAPYDAGEQGGTSGSAYIFNRSADDAWTQQNKLTTAIDGNFKDYFGLAVSVFGSFATIGAPQDDNDYGFAQRFLGSSDPDDADGDGIPLSNDNCGSVANPDQHDNDGDGAGDACDIDDDNDGVLDKNDNAPWSYNPDQLDTDQDGIGDVVDTDDDNDGVLDKDDNCSKHSNADQLDTDQDGIGDACEDGDSDGVPDSTDNCPAAANPDQADSDQDGIGDACDQDGKKSVMPPIIYFLLSR
ncbi:MAG: thrombospondin type 3 repeat-containing protein [Candidatus Electronema sp. VV]